MKYLLTLLLFASLSALRAEITILSTTRAPSSSRCEGEIVLRATGTAGPFTVMIPGTGGRDTMLFERVDGDLTISNLCGGTYQVVIYPTAYPACEHSFWADLQPAIFGVQGSEVDGVLTSGKSLQSLKEGELAVAVSPNPADGPVKVTISGLPTKPAAASSQYMVSFLDGNGRVQRREVVPVAAVGVTTTFPLNIGELPSGAYVVRVVRTDGAEGAVSLVVR